MLNERQQNALNAFVDKLEKMGLGSDPSFITAITPATPTMVEMTMMITATVAGNCVVPEELQGDREKLIEALGSVTSVDDLLKLRR